MKLAYKPLFAILAVSLTGCVSVPTGPSRLALPGNGKSFEQFQGDDFYCRQYAQQSSGVSTANAQQHSAIQSATVGTLVGAAAGALIGGNSRSAGTGAGVGLLFGAASGANAGERSAYMTQKRYDDGYTQCMYAKGHKVSVPAGMARQYEPAVQRPTYPTAPSYQYLPPPPPGSAPPPTSTK